MIDGVGAIVVGGAGVVELGAEHGLDAAQLSFDWEQEKPALGHDVVRRRDIPAVPQAAPVTLTKAASMPIAPAAA